MPRIRKQQATKPPATPFAAGLQKWLDARKLDRIDLIEASGLGKSAIAYYLVGEREPLVSSVARIADVLRLSDSQLGKLVRLSLVKSGAGQGESVRGGE